MAKNLNKDTKPTVVLAYTMTDLFTMIVSDEEDIHQQYQNALIQYSAYLQLNNLE